jgi:PAS domain S-box-containing protein
MKVQTKLIILVSIIIILFTAGLIYTNQLERQRIAILFKNRIEEKKALLDMVINLNGSGLKNFAYDYTIWDDMVEFVKEPSAKWAEENIESSLSTYKANAVWIYRNDFSPVYHIDNLETPNLSISLFPHDSIAQIFSRDKFCHFFLKDSCGLMEIQGAPIQPTSDVERITAPQGYFLAARLWDGDYLDEIARLTESHLCIVSYDSIKADDSANFVAEGIINFSQPIMGWDKRPVALIHAQSNSPNIAEMNKMAHGRLMVLVFFTFSILIILLVALMKWVNSPLNLLSRSLDKGDASELKNLKKDNSEFGHLAEMIKTFFEQNADLIKEVIERTEAEKALRESETFFKTLFDTTRAGVVVIDVKEQKIVDINQYALEKIGVEKNALLGKDCNEVLYRSYKEYCLPHKKRNIAEYSEETIHRTDGTSLTIMRSAITVNRRGREYLIESFVDVSELKKAEQKLQESARQLAILADEQKILLENTRDFIYRRDITGKYYYISPSVERITGYTPEEWQNSHLSYLTDADINVEGRRRLKNIATAESEYPAYLIEINRRDGKIIQLEFNEQIYLSDNAIAGVIGVARDVTERRSVERKLRQSEERYRYLIENITDGVIISDFETGRIIYANSTACAISGYELPEMIGLDFFSLVVPEDLEKLKTEIKKRQIGQESHYEISVIRKDGQRRCITMTAKPYFDNQGILRGAFAVFSDITDLKQADEDRRQLREKLERAERMESLGLLAGGVAHDLNNILGPLVAYPEMIMMKLPADSPIRKQVGIIGRSAREAADVIADLLSLARRGRYEMIPTSLNKIIEEFMESPSFVGLSEKNQTIKIIANLNDKIDSLMGSSSHLMKVVMNLIYNSFDAMPQGGTLTITTHQKNIDRLISGYDKIIKGDYIILSVKDTGMGIDPKDIGKIFEPYFSKKKMSGRSGSGLGLSVVYGIIKDHKGYYDILSEPGKGTEFILYFPAIKVNNEAKSESVATYGGTERILVVDDIEEQRDVISQLLMSLGYHVETASSGQEAVKEFAGNKYDLVVLDMIMEKNYDGYDTYKDIVNLHSYQKAVLISGFSATERVEMAQAIGAGKFVKKPFSRDIIAQAIRDELDKNKDRSDIPTPLPSPSPK